MHNSVTECLGLTNAGVDFLKIIEQQMSIVADLSRADILLYGQKSPEEVVILTHTQAHSLTHMYSKSREGRIVSVDRRPEVRRALISGKRQKEQRSFISEGAPVVRQVFPIYFPPSRVNLPDLLPQTSWPQEQARVVAALVIATTLIEHERHRLRSPVYRRALENLQAMLLCGQVLGAENLSSFGEQDGILFTDSEGIIRYASGIAASLYRRVGYKEALVGRHLAELETGDEELRRAVLTQKCCLEWEASEAGRFWIRKAVPLISYPSPYRAWLKRLNLPQQAKEAGVLILLHDATESRRQDQEIRIKNAMIQEVHHRVKNNLQTIAGLLRMQARRVKSDEARLVLDEALNRIFSVAVIHEFLSSDSSNIINVKEVSIRIIKQLQQGMLNPDKIIRLQVTGDPIYLPARQATACSLIINELVQNALEHGFEQRQEGFIRVNLEDNGDEVIITVVDNGAGVPDSFQMDQADSLGLQIVKILVEGDLKGQIQLNNGVDDNIGLDIKIIFSKNIFRGEEGWKEHVSL
jgi:two-component sensor histidine kinase